MANGKEEARDEEAGGRPERVLSDEAGGRTYYINIPVRPLWGNVDDENLDRITMYYTIYAFIFGVVGAIAVLLPLFLNVEVKPLLSWLLVFAGTISLGQFLLICGAPGTMSFLLLGAIHLCAGLWLLIQPLDGTPSFTVIIIIWFLLHGFVKIAMAYSLQRLTTWPAVVLSGFASIAAVVVILFLTSWLGQRLISWCFGADLGLTGLSFILIAIMAFLGKGKRTITDAEAIGEPLLGSGNAAASA